MFCPLFMACPLFAMSTIGRFHWLMGWSRTCLWIAGRCVGGGHVGESVVGGSVVSGSVVICSVGLWLVVGGRWFCNTPKWSRNLYTFLMISGVKKWNIGWVNKTIWRWVNIMNLNKRDSLIYMQLLFLLTTEESSSKIGNK